MEPEPVESEETKLPVPPPGPTPKAARAWCRDKYGADWWADKTIKKQRLENARVALGGPVKPARKSQTLKPLKRTYLLRMRVREEGCSEKRTRVDPASVLQGPVKKIGKCEECDLPYWGVYLIDPTDWQWDYNEDLELDLPNHAYCGSHPFASDGPIDYVPYDEHNTHEMFVQQIMKGWDKYTEGSGFHAGFTAQIQNETLVIHDEVWYGLSPATRETLLRDSTAKEVYICEIVDC